MLLTCCHYIKFNVVTKKYYNIKIILLFTKQKSSQSEYSIFFNQPLVWEPIVQVMLVSQGVKELQ